MELPRIGLGGGCHWCTEGVFVSLDGVASVEQGWIASRTPYDLASEAVVVRYDPRLITLEQLLDVHLRTHSAFTAHALRGKYRSAVYYYYEEQRIRSERWLAEVKRVREQSPLTLVLPFGEFIASPPEYRDYYRTDPERPFCRRYITPKVERLRLDRPELFSAGKQ